MKCRRRGLEVEVIKYEPGKGLEDGYELFSDVVVNGWITTEILVKIKREDGAMICPFISNKRGRIFIGKDDYIIKEGDGERHVCGSEKFKTRFEILENQ